MKDEASVVTSESFLKSVEQGRPLNEALGLSDADLNNLAGLAAAFYQEGQRESALKLLQGLTAMRPERPEYWGALGAVLTALERHEEAVPALSVAIKMDPADTAALVNRGECYMALADPEKAGKDFEAAITLDSKQADPAANRARQLVYGFSQFFEQCSESGLDTMEVEDDRAE